MLGIAALAAVPMLAVLVAMVVGEADVWGRLWATTLPRYLLNTGTLMALTGVLAALFGVGTAWCVAMMEFPGRRLLSWMLILPLAAPAYIVAYYYVDLLDAFGPVQTGLRALTGWGLGDYPFPPIRTLPGAALILALTLYPYVYLLARAAFSVQNSAQWHAARSLGLSPWRSFRSVSLPSARPAIAGGLALVLMETLADFGVADYFGISTFSTGIFRTWLAGGDRGAAMMLAGVMLLVVFALVAFEASSRRGRVASTGRMRAQDAPLALSRGRGWAVTVLCALPVLFGFLIPFMGLAIMTLNGGDGRMEAFLVFAQNSVTVAVLVMIVCTVVALSLAYAKRARGGLGGVIRLATLGYALPGALLAVGLLGPLGWLDQRLTRGLVDLFGWNGGLVLTGTLIALVYALTVRFLTIAFNSLSSGYAAVTPAMDHAARSLGASPWQLVRRVHLPLLRSSVAAGAMLVFIDVMRELPATLILRPFNFETLATRVYWLASDERLAEASTAALLIVVLGLVPVLLLNLVSEGRVSDRSR